MRGGTRVYLGHILAVVVPAHNEEHHIGRTLAAIPGFVDKIFAIDDASSDGTVGAIASASRRDPRIQPLEHDRNRGVGAAIVTGFRLALEEGAEIVAVMDGDGQMHPRDLPALVEPLCRGDVDMTKGLRFIGLRPRGSMPVTRWAGNLILSAATRLASGWSGSLDSQCGYVALTASALRRVPLDALFPRYGFPNDLFMRAVECGLVVESVSVRAVYGDEVSGIKAHVAIPHILALLWHGWLRRVRPAPSPTSAMQRVRVGQRP